MATILDALTSEAPDNNTANYNKIVNDALLAEWRKKKGQPVQYGNTPWDSAIDAANRINQGALERGSNTIATLDKNGHVVVTGGAGVVTDRATGNWTLAGSGTIQNQSNTPSPVATLKNMMREAENAKSVEERLNKIYEISGAFAKLDAEYTSSAFEQAASEFRVPELKSQLDTAIQADMADPMYEAFKTDSPITAKIRSAYEGAVSSANSQALKYLAQNREYAELKGMLEPFLKAQTGLTESELRKRDIKMEEQAQLASTLGTSHLRLAKLVEPGADNIPEVALRYVRDNDFKETSIAMHSQPEALLQMSLTGSNRYARIALIDAQATRLSGSTDEDSYDYKNAKAMAEADLRQLEKLTNDHTAFMTTVKNLIPNEKMRNKFLEEYTLLSQDPSRNKDRRNIRASLAPQLLSMAKYKEFESNVDSWTTSSVFRDSNTIISKVYSNLEMKPPTLDAVISGIMKLPSELRPRAIEELRQAGQKHVSKAMNGIYGSAGDSIDLNTIISSKITSAIEEKHGIGITDFINFYSKHIFGL